MQDSFVPRHGRLLPHPPLVDQPAPLGRVSKGHGFFVAHAISIIGIGSIDNTSANGIIHTKGSRCSASERSSKYTIWPANDLLHGIAGIPRPCPEREAETGANEVNMPELNHSSACNLCRLEASRLGGMLLPYSNGLFWPVENGKPAANGRPVRIGRTGAADLIGTINGRAVACEVKVGRDTQRAEQEKFQAAWEAAGGVYVISRDGDVSVLGGIK